MLGLMHSALDIEDTRLHAFSQWLNNEEFVDTPRKGRDVTPMPRFRLLEPLKFHDFSGDRQSNYCGYGLKNIQKINKGDDIVSMALEMGLVSNILVDEGRHYPEINEHGVDEDQELLDQLLANTKKVSKTFFPAEI